MPNRFSKEGNPTRSIEVQTLIKDVRLAEVRKQGAPSKARRPLHKSEFEQTIKLLETNHDIQLRYMVPASARFFYNMIARVDDTAEFKKEDLKPHTQFDFALQVKMCWSKNIREERESPDQILIGANDPMYCVLLSLAIYLEVWFGAGEEHNQFLFGKGDTAKKNLRLMSKAFRDTWKRPDFVKVKPGLLGTHSLRKFPCTMARNAGCSKDETDHRGRWRKRRVSDRYVDINLPYPDAKVAGKLCIGGPIKYALKQDCGLDREWLRSHVVPNIVACTAFSEGVADVLALPLLWASFESTVCMPDYIRDRITTAYSAITNNLQGNPVVKVPLLIIGHDDIVDIQPILSTNDGIHTQNSMTERNNELFDLVYSQNVTVTTKLAGIETRISDQSASFGHELGLVRQSINRLQPAMHYRFHDRSQQRSVNVVANQQQAEAPTVITLAQLQRNPKTLHALWQEYNVGVGGMKAAKDFTEKERGKVKVLYCRRKVYGMQSHILFDQE